MEEAGARIEQERNISASFRFRTRSAAILQHKGKLGICLVMIIFAAILLSAAASCWTKEKCQNVGRAYQLCNRTLRNGEKTVCYKYENEKERKALGRIYQQCVVNSPNNSPRCTRHSRNGNITSKRFILPTNYNHDFFIAANDSEPISVYTFINRSCVLNTDETEALFRGLK